MLGRLTMDRLTRGFHRLGIAIAVPIALAWSGVAITLWVVEGPPDDVPLYGVISVNFGPLLGAGLYLLLRAAAWVVNGFRE
jgi:hypothetical protein